MTNDIDRLIENLADEAVVVKPAPHPVKLSMLWLGAAAVYLAIALALGGVRPDLMQQLHEPWFVAELVALIGITITTSFSAALLAFPDLHQQRRLVALPAWLFGLFIVVIYFAWRADNPPASIPEHTFECTLSIILMTLLPAAWMFYTLRRFASTHYRLAGSIALLFAFSVGALWLRLCEIDDSISHLIQWHYLPMFGVGLLGLWLGRVLLKW